MWRSERAKRLGYHKVVQFIINQIGWGEFDDGYCDNWEMVT